MKTREGRVAMDLTTCRSNDISEEESIITVFTGTFASSDDPDKKCFKVVLSRVEYLE